MTDAEIEAKALQFARDVQSGKIDYRNVTMHGLWLLEKGMDLIGALKYIPTPFDSYDYIAGWVSDAA